MNKLVGIFSMDVPCHEGDAARYNLTLDDGEVVDLGTSCADHNQWIGQRVMVYWLDDVAGWAVAHTSDPVIAAEERMRLRKHVKVALVRIVPAHAKEMADPPHARAEAMQDYLNAATQRDYRFEVLAFAIRLIDGEKMPNRGEWCLPTLRRLRDTDPVYKAFDPDHVQLQGGVDPMYGGWGMMPGKYSMVFEDTGVDSNMHELGHNLGLPHSDLQDPETGNIKRYGDVTCVMGDGTPARGFNAVKLSSLGMGTAKSVKVIRGDTDSFFLVPADRPSEDAGLPDNVYRWAEYPLDDLGNTLIISNRNGRNGPLETVEIHLKRRGASSLFLRKLRLGESYDDNLPVAIQHMGVYPQYGLVAVKVGTGESSGVPVLPHWPLGSTVPGPGWYWRADCIGHGILYDGRRLYLWTFDANGEAVFLFSQLDDGVPEFLLFDSTDKVRGKCTFSELEEGSYLFSWVIDKIPGSALLSKLTDVIEGSVEHRRNTVQSMAQLYPNTPGVPVELEFVPAVKVAGHTTEPSYYTIRVNNSSHKTKMSGGYTFALITDKEEVYDAE